MRQLAGALIPVLVGVMVSIGAEAPVSGTVVINEIAWSGSVGDPTAEWIELHNPSEEPIDLAGWCIASSDGSPSIQLQGTIDGRVDGDPSTGFYLLERVSDDTVPEIEADQIYTGALTDRGETLLLCDATGAVVDTANVAMGEMEGWTAGTDRYGEPPHASMERRDPRRVDSHDNWATSSAELHLGEDRDPIRGTPRHENSVFNLPPLASFVVSPRPGRPSEPVSFDASSSTDPNDQIVSYRWSFGDGTRRSGATVRHIYPHVGSYEVVLVLVDGKGAVSELARTIRIQAGAPPVADFSVVPDDGAPRAGEPILFLDESSDVDGAIEGRTWRFDDGAIAGGPSVLHTYRAAGTYIVSLEAVDSQGESATQTQSLVVRSQRPHARFCWSPENPIPGDPIRFDASASHDADGRIERYRWDLDGDGTDDHDHAEPIVDHAFPSAGERAIRLTVVDDAGERASVTRWLTVNLPPVAEFEVSSFEAAEQCPIHLTDASHDEDGTIIARRWTFDDGGGSEASDPVHAYVQEGTYAIRLTVTDDRGAEDTATAEIRIVNLTPRAHLVADPASLPTGATCTFDASGSVDPSPHGTIIDYAWDLDGDGTFEQTTTCPSVDHVYEDDGARRVRVRVTDDDGAWDEAQAEVEVVNRPPRVSHIRWDPQQPTDDEPLQFAATVHDPDGEVAAWFWEFGNEAAATDPTPVARFDDDGSHPVVLTVEDNDGDRSSPFSIVVDVANAPPVAVFTTSNLGGGCVRFDARDAHDPSPRGEIVHVAWSFGDGATASGTGADRWTPVHCYGESGTYIVSLIVIDDQGALAKLTKSLRVER